MNKLLIASTILFLFSCSNGKKISIPEKSILVFSKTQAFRHASIKEGKLAMLQLGAENGWIVDTTEDASVFTSQGLSKYKAIVFLSTSGDVLNEDQQQAFQQYIHAGGGFVGIHAAADTEKDWPWYNNLVGGLFKSHPKPQEATYVVTDKSFPAVSFMPDNITRLEEIYNFYSFKKDLVHVVMTVDETSYTGGTMGNDHPAAWYHEFEGGKAFYTAWGHRPEAFKESIVLQQIAAAIKWAMK